MEEERSSSTQPEKQLIIIPPAALVPPLVVRVAQPIPITLNLVPKPLHIPDLLPSPPGNLLGRILHVINSIVETPLDSIAETVESLLDSLRGVLNIVNGIVETALNGVAELVKVLLDSLRSIFDVLHGVVVTTLDRVAELIKVLLDIVADAFGFAYVAAGPFGGTLGEIWWELVFWVGLREERQGQVVGTHPAAAPPSYARRSAR